MHLNILVVINIEAHLDVELRRARFCDILLIQRQLLLHGTPSTAIPLHYLDAAANIAVVHKLALYSLSMQRITRGF